MGRDAIIFGFGHLINCVVGGVAIVTSSGRYTLRVSRGTFGPYSYIGIGIIYQLIGRRRVTLQRRRLYGTRL